MRTVLANLLFEQENLDLCVYHPQKDGSQPWKVSLGYLLLFDKFSVEYYYPRNINEDPLEIVFGRIHNMFTHLNI